MERAAPRMSYTEELEANNDALRYAEEEEIAEDLRDERRV